MRMTSNSTRRRLVLGALIATMTVTMAACSSSPAKHSKHPRTTSSVPVTTPSTSAPSTVGALTGAWSGQYSGAYTGTFNLTWTQTGSKLNGTIHISSLGGTATPIHGTVNGNTISFGTVGSTAVTYTGTVSGNSMSGTYQVGGQSGGPWSATKS